MNKTIFNSFPVLETERLGIKQMSQDDAPKVFEFNSSLETLKYVPRDPFKDLKQGIEKTNSFIEGFQNKNAIWWKFTLKKATENSELIGYGGLFNICPDSSKAEIGYGLLKKHWGQGIISEAVKEIVEFGINKMQLHKVYALIDPDNIPSIKIVEKLNFKKEGVLKDDAFARNKYFDMSVYAIISDK